jgi:hypothetical protein
MALVPNAPDRRRQVVDDVDAVPRHGSPTSTDMAIKVLQQPVGRRRPPRVGAAHAARADGGGGDLSRDPAGIAQRARGAAVAAHEGVTMADGYTLNVRRFDARDPRLGRHVVHDSRSRRFAGAGARSEDSPQVVRHTVHIPVIDQGDVGSCTGHAGTNALASGDFWPAAGRVAWRTSRTPTPWAVLRRHVLDPWPGRVHARRHG